MSGILRLDLPSQIHLGPNSMYTLGNRVREMGGKRALIIMDTFLAKSEINLGKTVKEMLDSEVIESVFFSEYSGEPTTEHVSRALKVLREFKGDCVVSIGGGSAIDIGKAVALFSCNEHLEWTDIVTMLHHKRLPFIAVPTTAGTGSEATKVMVITNTETNIKMNPGHPRLIPDIAILDPELTLSLPQNFTAYTGLDALSHAMEAYVSTNSTIMTEAYALEAIERIGKSLPVVYENGNDIEARQNMLLGSCYAGIAFSNASTNLAHAAGRPLGARFHIPHGLSVALLMPYVVEYGLESAGERYANIAIALGADPNLSQEELSRKTLEILHDYNDKFHIWEDGKKYIDVDDFRRNITLLGKDALSGNGILTNLKVPNQEDLDNLFTKLADKLSSLLIKN